MTAAQASNVGIINMSAALPFSEQAGRGGKFVFQEKQARPSSLLFSQR